jgi:hypothetical protein
MIELITYPVPPLWFWLGREAGTVARDFEEWRLLTRTAPEEPADG